MKKASPRLTPVPEETEIPVPKNPLPVEVDDMRFDPSDEDAFMEDASQISQKGKDLTNSKKEGLQVTKRTGRKSDIQAMVNEEEIFERMLSGNITLTTAELLGLSGDLAARFREALKRKSVDRDRKSTRLNSSHSGESRMPSSA